MPLPLVIRKSLRDNEEHLKDAVEKIQTVLGVEWTFEFDFESIHALIPDTSDLGGLFYKDVAGSILNCIERCAKDEMAKEALVEANTSQKIVVIANADKKNNTYWQYKFENGELRVYFRVPLCNISDLCYFPLQTVVPNEGVFSLPARLNLKAAQEKIEEALEKAKAATKMEWNFDESSLETIYPSLEKSNQDRIGETFAEILAYVCENIVKRCADEMVLEALQETCTNAKITFKMETKQSEYWAWKFVSGDLVVSFRSICNISDNCYYNFEKLL